MSSSSIPSRKIGNTDVPAIGFGVMGLSVGYGAVDGDEERLKVLDAAYESGSTFWDTADVYGDSEELIGKWFKRNPDKRSKIFLATKFGARFDGPSRGDPQYVKEQFQKSLDRLGVDYVDLYYQHRVDPSTPIEKTVGAMAELVKAGKVKYLGLSECTPNGLRRANSVHPISALQIEYSAFERPPADLLATAREFGTKIIAYSPLGRGLLTGQVKSIDDLEAGDARRIFPKFQDKENFARILKLSDTIKDIGGKHGATAGQAALAWVLAQGEDVFVIPGTKKVKVRTYAV
ncbi:Aldo-keto reductase str7 [Marasmius tenuissimus]|uniref:Aldo-keto reductase str7 n=1 Tax=Marasmius tenuissimus TaxID=585030 RepID=A0ABR3AH03_9AGAR